MGPVQYAQWHHFFEDTPVSSVNFYKSLEAGLTTKKVPDVAVARVDKLEGGPLSARRTYLEIKRDWLTYHVCAAPFGTGFFVSSRLLVWPFESWRILAAVGAALIFFLIIVFGTIASAWSPVFAFPITAFFAFPTIFLFALIVLAWYLYCRHLTYYRMDTMLSFHDAVHHIVVSVVNQTVEASGRKPLSETESKPILHKLLER